MPRLITDDAPRRLRGVWLGPKGVRWPVDWTFAQWGVFALLTVVCPVVIFAVFALLNWYLAICNGVLWGPVAAFFLTKWVMKFVDYDRPIRYWLKQLRGEWRRSRRIPAEVRVRADLKGVSIANLAHALEGYHLLGLPARKRKAADA